MLKDIYVMFFLFMLRFLSKFQIYIDTNNDNEFLIKFLSPHY